MESFSKQNPYRLIPNIVDQIAQDEPDKPYIELPISPIDFNAGFRQITYGVLANAVNGVAWWLTQTLGPGTGFPTLAYIGPNDLGHNLLLLGAIKAGYKMLFTSPRYSVEAQVGLMKTLDCNAMLTSSVVTPLSALVQKIAEEHGSCQVLQVPELGTFLDETNIHQPFPYSKTYEEAHDEPVVVLHTSGTTGFPKPIVLTHGWASSFAHQRYLEPPEGYERLEILIVARRVLSMMPPFHASNVFATILFAFYCDTLCILPPALVPPTAEIAVTASQHTQFEAILVVPPYVEQIGSKPELVDTLVKNGVKNMFWAGGPVSKRSSDTVASRMKLFNTSGSTEMGMWPVICKAGPWDTTISRDMCFHPHNNIDFREQSEGLFKAVQIKNSPEVGVQPVFHIFRDVTEFDSGDLFTRGSEPGKKHLWTYYGRSDDMQVFHSGLNWHPSVAERKIVSENSDLVQEALLDGMRREHVILLLELVPSITTELAAISESGQTARKGEILDRIWPSITEINHVTPAWVQIDRRRVVFCEAGKPLARTAKGSIQRHQAVANYEPQIQEILQRTDRETAV